MSSLIDHLAEEWSIDPSTLVVPLSVDIPVVGLERLESVECESEPV